MNNKPHEGRHPLDPIADVGGNTPERVEEQIKWLELRSLYEQVISRINKLDDDTREAKGHLNILVLDRFLADITKLVGENEVKKKAIFKYNNSHGALLCSGCRVILKDGSSFSDEEMEAFQGVTELEAQYCNTCKAGKKNET